MEQPATLARSAVFAPIEELGRADAVTARLEEAIVLGILQPGERLPSEARLAERFGVAPVTVREALADLRERRLVTTQRGRGGGSFVTVVEDDRVRAVEQRICAMTNAELSDLGTYGTVIVGAGARLAAREATSFELASLRRDLEAADFAEEFAARRALGGFHLQLVALGRSVRLVRAQLALQHADGPLLWASMFDADERAAIQEASLALVDRLDEGDGDGAQATVAATCARAARWLLVVKQNLEA
ncbi:MAG: GntR family transcriptional regulator [Microbacterium sp.]